MSRIAKYPVALPKGVDVDVAAGQISVKGPLGTIARSADPNVEVKKDGESLVFAALGNSNHANAMSGTMRALVANMVTGVTKGFEKRLALVGVGFRAQAQGEVLDIALVLQHLGDRGLEARGRHGDLHVAHQLGVADAGQHVGDRIVHAHRVSSYQLALMMPGTSPRIASSRSLLRPSPNLR